jgi:hypothetical protein
MVHYIRQLWCQNSEIMVMVMDMDTVLGLNININVYEKLILN